MCVKCEIIQRILAKLGWKLESVFSGPARFGCTVSFVENLHLELLDVTL